MKEYEHDLDQEMISELSEEFDPQEFIKNLDLSSSKEIENEKSAFKKYGSRLVNKSIELGEENPDRIYEIMKNAGEKTGELKFPLFPERYVEISYLSIEPFKRLWVHSNSPEIFSYEIKECNVYEAIKEEYGEEASNKMTCKEACFSIIGEAFDYFDLDVEKNLDAEMAKDGKCLFKVIRKSGE